VRVQKVGSGGEVTAVSDVDDGVYAFNKTVRRVVITKITGNNICFAVRVTGAVREN
jgi:DNA-binding protein